MVKHREADELLSQRKAATPTKFDAITLEHSYELSERERTSLIYTKDMLLAEHPKPVPLRTEGQRV